MAPIPSSSPNDSWSEIRRMIRVLFIVLAVISMGLAFILDIPWLYLVAAGMLVAAAVILTLDTRERMRRDEVAGSRPKPPSPPVAPADELKSLGIMEIRPAAPRGSRRETALADGAREADMSESRPTQKITREPAAEESASSGRSAHSESGRDTVRTAQAELDLPPPPPRQAADAPPPGMVRTEGGGELFRNPIPAGTVRKRPRTARIMVEGVSSQLREEVILSTLRAFRAAVDATTVAILREEASPLGYTVEAIVSRNAFARSGGRFAASEPLVTSGRTLIPVTRRCNGSGGFDARRLGYYHEPIAIHEVAFVPMRRQDETYLLVADTMLDDALGEPEALRMLSEFSRLLQALLEEAAPSHDGPEGESLRPRREIIAEEMSAARKAERPLALALVHLNKADTLQEDERSEAELALESRLRSSASGGRVERFGELTYGILSQDDVEKVARWASALHSGKFAEGGPLTGGISIGVAMLGDRHDGPDELRADATAALRESYETGECVILE